jgi:hypothetical protein
MCFSAAGSFGVAGVLLGVGAASLGRNDSSAHRMYAAVPLIFAAQQAAEGVVWLTVGWPSGALLPRLAVDAFLGIALVLWPLWLPGALLRLEADAARRRVLKGLCWIGLIVAACAALLLLQWQPAARVAGHSIRYDYSSGAGAWPPGFYLACYAIPTVAPFFFSSAILARITGLALVASLVLAFIVQRDALTSVWCFFAALLSALVFVTVTREMQPRRALALGVTP